MSAVIMQMVMRRRAARAQALHFQACFDSVVAKAAGEDGKDGRDGEDGRGITNAEIKRGEFILTFSDGTKKNLGRVVSDRVVMVGGDTIINNAPTGGDTSVDQIAEDLIANYDAAKA